MSVRCFRALIAAALLAFSGCSSRPDPLPTPPWLLPDPPPEERPGPTEPNPTPGTVELEAEGKGITRDAAKTDALRNALERGAGLIIRGESLVVDWQLARDVVLAEMRGVVVSYDVLEMEEKDGVFAARVRAVVSAETIAEDLSILHELSNHARIACAIVDFVDDEPAETTLAQSALEHALLERKFNVVDLSQLEAVKARDRVRAFGDLELARALGERWGCDILITGKSFVDLARAETVYGVRQVFCTATIEAKAVTVNPAQVIASESATARRGADVRARADKLALDAAGEAVARKLITKIVLHLRKGSTDEQAIELAVRGVTFEQLTALEAALTDIPGVRRVVSRQYRDGAATLECAFRGDAQTLARHLGELGAPQLEVLAVERRRVEVRMKEP